MLYIVGLGPGDPDLISRRGFELLSLPNSQVVLRTGKHQVATLLSASGLLFATYDYLYDSLPDFEQVYAAIVADIARRYRHSDVVYAVPGNPMVAESTVQELLAMGVRHGWEIKVILSPSSLEAVFAALGIDPTKGVAIGDALDRSISIDPSLSWLLTQVHSRLVAGDLKLRLLQIYPPEHRVAVVRDAGSVACQVIRLPLAELDHREFTSVDTVYVPACREARHIGRAMEELAQVMNHLRGQDGCPWDKEQTHLSLRPFLIEEAYEVLAALEGDDKAELAKELGDLLLQVVFHAQIARENGDFDLFDCITELVAKLVRRHPHVFGDSKATTAHQVEEGWRRIKQAEKATQGEGYLDSIPMNLPALQLAYKFQARAGQLGLDWPSIAGVIAKVDEEIAELRQAIHENDPQLIAGELGDLLFSLVNLSRFLEVEPETALRGSIYKFRQRCARVIQMAASLGMVTNECSLAELDSLWDEAKSKENTKRYNR